MQTMGDRDCLILLDGEMVAWREAKTHVLTHTLHYGMGVFEGVRAYHAEQGTAKSVLHWGLSCSFLLLLLVEVSF